MVLEDFLGLRHLTFWMKHFQEEHHCALGLDERRVATCSHMVMFYRYVERNCSMIYGVSEESDLTVVEIGTARDQTNTHTMFVFDVNLKGIEHPHVPR